MTRAGWLVLSACVLAAACASPDDRTLTVFAAASLVDAMGDLEAAFESSHPATDVVVSTAGSQQLASQILDGAPADVFVSADLRQLQAADERLASAPRLVATNALVVAVREGNPDHIDGLPDLGDDELVVVLPAPEVPAGAYARAALRAAGVELTPDDLTPDVRGALAKVVLGEADAAVVYATDAAARTDEVDAIPIGTETAVTYHAAVVEGSDRPELAAAFVDFLLAPSPGGRILARHGFGAP